MTVKCYTNGWIAHQKHNWNMTSSYGRWLSESFSHFGMFAMSCSDRIVRMLRLLWYLRPSSKSALWNVYPPLCIIIFLSILCKVDSMLVWKTYFPWKILSIVIFPCQDFHGLSKSMLVAPLSASPNLTVDPPAMAMLTSEWRHVFGQTHFGTSVYMLCGCIFI